MRLVNASPCFSRETCLRVKAVCASSFVKPGKGRVSLVFVFFLILWHQFCYKRSLVMAVADLGFKSRVVEEKMNMLYRV
jgi:hypothetical protein